jgi:adenosine deaminase
MAETHGLNPEAVVEAVVDGVRAGVRDTGVQANLIGIISRTYGPEVGWQELASLLAHRDHLVALDLAGDEANWPGELFVEHFAKARNAGLQVTVHAGEAAGAASIWQAVRGLNAARIGHGVAADANAPLVQYLAENEVAVECNLTSNVQTSTVSDYQSHPMQRFLEQGLLASLNTDDPGISAIDLPFEYNVAARAAGLSREQVRQAQRNAWATAFLTDDERQAILVSRNARDGLAGEM